MIRYDISPLDPEAHYFIVALKIPHPTPKYQSVQLNSWISGSYLIRDYASHIQKERAFIGSKPVPIEKTALDTWRVKTEDCDKELTILYEVYAFDTSVRGAYLDSCRGFFNPGAVFMRAVGHESEKILLNIAQCDDEIHGCTSGWSVGTALCRHGKTKRFDWGLYRADSFEELIDNPVELSDFSVLTFKSQGTRYDILINNTAPNFDEKRLVSDVKRICDYEISFFEPKTKQAPFKEYVFLLNVTCDLYGGLEHRNCCALSAPFKTLPCTHNHERSKDYATLLGLFAHEYFHAWNVKRIKPTEFVQADYTRPVTTRLLWLFEGFTSYYDDLILRRVELIDDKAYADLLSASFKSVLETNARSVQSLAQSSFDAWIKFYKPNANSVNSVVSYYKQGALAALALDLTVRAKTKNKASLDDFMRALWNRYTQAEDYEGVMENDIAQLLYESTGVKCDALLKKLTKSTSSVNYERLLKPFGGSFEQGTVDRARLTLGIDGTITQQGFVVKHVFEGEAGQWAGIASGDTLIAIDGIRLCPETFESTLSRYDCGDEMVIHAFRDNAMLVWTILIGKTTPVKSKLSLRNRTALAKPWLEG